MLYLPMNPIIIWNVRGVRNNPTIRNVKKVMKDNKASIVVLCEPFIDASRQGRVAERIGLNQFIHNQLDGGKIWIFWNNDY